MQLAIRYDLYQDLDQLLSKQTRHREKLRNESSLLKFIDLVESKFMVASLHTLLIMEIRMLLYKTMKLVNVRLQICQSCFTEIDVESLFLRILT